MLSKRNEGCNYNLLVSCNKFTSVRDQLLGPVLSGLTTQSPRPLSDKEMATVLLGGEVSDVTLSCPWKHGPTRGNEKGGPELQPGAMAMAQYVMTSEEIGVFYILYFFYFSKNRGLFIG